MELTLTIYQIAHYKVGFTQLTLHHRTPNPCHLDRSPRKVRRQNRYNRTEGGPVQTIEITVSSLLMLWLIIANSRRERRLDLFQ